MMQVQRVHEQERQPIATHRCGEGEVSPASADILVPEHVESASGTRLATPKQSCSRSKNKNGPCHSVGWAVLRGARLACPAKQACPISINVPAKAHAYTLCLTTPCTRSHHTIAMIVQHIALQPSQHTRLLIDLMMLLGPRVF